MGEQADPTERVAEALRLHGDLCTRANADYLAKVVIDALQRHDQISLTETERTIAAIAMKHGDGGTFEMMLDRAINAVNTSRVEGER